MESFTVRHSQDWDCVRVLTASLLYLGVPFWNFAGYGESSTWSRLYVIQEDQHLVCLQGVVWESCVLVKLLSPLISIWFVFAKTDAEVVPSRIVWVLRAEPHQWVSAFLV